jgi:hypothetical protein
MSSGRLNKHIVIKNLNENRTYLNLIVSKLVTPFPSDHGIEFIYDGTEDIPFKERHPLYQKILVKEFVLSS